MSSHLLVISGSVLLSLSRNQNIRVGKELSNHRNGIAKDHGFCYTNGNEEKMRSSVVF